MYRKDYLNETMRQLTNRENSIEDYMDSKSKNETAVLLKEKGQKLKPKNLRVSPCSPLPKNNEPNNPGRLVISSIWSYAVNISPFADNHIKLVAQNISSHRSLY